MFAHVRRKASNFAFLSPWVGGTVWQKWSEPASPGLANVVVAFCLSSSFSSFYPMPRTPDLHVWSRATHRYGFFKIIMSSKLIFTLRYWDFRPDIVFATCIWWMLGTFQWFLFLNSLSTSLYSSHIQILNIILKGLVPLLCGFWALCLSGIFDEWNTTYLQAGHKVLMGCNRLRLQSLYKET